MDRLLVHKSLAAAPCLPSTHPTTMSDKTPKEAIIELIVDQLGVDASDVTPEANLVADLGADSLDEVELIMALEEEFNIEISDSDASECKTVQHVIDIVEKAKA